MDGKNNFGAVIYDEECFATKEVLTVGQVPPHTHPTTTTTPPPPPRAADAARRGGQVIAVVVAETQDLARKAAAQVPPHALRLRHCWHAAAVRGRGRGSGGARAVT